MDKPVEETRPVSAKKAAGKAAGATKMAAKKTAKKAPARKAVAATKSPVKKAPAKKATAKKVPAKKAAAAKKVAPATKAPARPVDTDLAERWTQAELADIRADLVEELGRLESEYAVGLTELGDLQQQANDGAGDDQADAGTKTFEREQELSLLHNKQELIAQSQRAIERIDAGTYGRCESCGEPIAKARLQAFPSATLCVSCKQKQERR